MRILVTGGAGFIGSAVIRYVLDRTDHAVCNVDKLTYASDKRLASLAHPRYHFERADICDAADLTRIFGKWGPDAVMHLAAESHVDRSIDGPAEFLQTNILGTFTLLEAALAYWRGLESSRQEQFRFHHVSTDEVYGDLDSGDPPFSETTPYRPSSPYAASKASSDHLVRAWQRTYGLPALISNCSNNYGPQQFPEKMIPLMIQQALEGRQLPVYGDGRQVRDWLYVEDHAEALLRVLTAGTPGETYNIGGLNEKANIDVVRQICALLEELRPEKPLGIAAYQDLIAFVSDRPGHDRRYAIDGTKIERDLGWRPRHSFEQGLRDTVLWYLENPDWSNEIKSSRYGGERLGLKVVYRDDAA